MDRRFYSDAELVVGGTVQLSGDESRHLKTVLRAQVGESVVLMDGRGSIADAEVVDLGGKRGCVSCRVTGNRVLPPLDNPVHLFVAPPRGKGMAAIVRMATEMGVAAITPILCRRCTGRPDASAISSWTATAITAVKQSKNPYLPQLNPPVPLADAVGSAPVPGLVGWVPDEGDTPAAEPPASGERSLFIGPEGGFEADEIKLILNAGIQPASFGPWTLRVETAVVAGLAILNRKVEP